MPISIAVGSHPDEPENRKTLQELREFFAKNNVEVRVNAKLNVTSAREAVREAKLLLRDLDAEFKVKAKLNRTSVRDAVREARELTKELDAEMAIKAKAKLDSASVKEAALKAKAELRNDDAEIRVKANVDRNSFSTIRALSDALGFVGDKAVEVGESVNQMGRQTAYTMRGLGVLAGAPVVLALFDIAKGAVTASQSIALLPAAASAAGAAMITLEMATSGFGNAIKDLGKGKLDDFAADLQGLAPNAQQAALSIQNLWPEFQKLQQATQNTFFRGFGEEIHRLASEYLPQVQSMTQGIASSFNEMVRGIGDQLMTPGTQTAMTELMNNISAAFNQLAPAARSFAQAFIDIAGAGSDFLPELAQNVSDAARQFADFIRQAKDSGKLREFIQNGIDAVKELATGIWNIGGLLYKAFGSDGKKNVEDLNDTLQGTIEIISILSGDMTPFHKNMQKEFEDSTGIIRKFDDVVADIPEVFARIANPIIDVLNMIKRPLDNFVSNVHDTIEMIKHPFDESARAKWNAPPDIGHIDTGNWAPYQGPYPDLSDRNKTGTLQPGQYRTRDGKVRQIPGGGTTPGSDFLGPYPGTFALPPPPPSAGSGGGGGGGGGSSLTGPMGTEPQFADIAKIAESFGLVMSSGTRNEPGSFHNSGEAGDFGMPGGGRDTDQMLAFAEFMRQNYGSQLAELIYQDPRFSGMMIDEGKSVADSFFANAGDHHNHVHVAATGPLKSQGYVPDPIQPGSGQASQADIAQMIYQSALSRGYSPQDAQSIVAYAIGESGLDPGISGGAQGGGGAENTVIGLFQEKPGFASAGGINPNMRADPASNITAYLNQLQQHQGGDIYDQLLATSKGGPVATGGRAAMTPLERQAADLLRKGGRASSVGIGSPSDGFSGVAPAGSGTPVFVTNWPGGGGFGGGGGAGGFGGGGAGGAGGDPLSAFFGGLSSGGGPLGPLGTLGTNIMGMLGGGNALGVRTGSGGGGVGASGGGLLGMLMNGIGQPGQANPSALGPGPLGGGVGGQLPPGVPSIMGPNIPGMPGGGTPPGPLQQPGYGGSGQPEVQGMAPGEGGWQPQGGGFKGLGGLPLAAIKGAASAAGGAGAMFGGQAAGAAVDIGIELANKAAAFGGQALAIGAQGLGETFLPHGSELGDPSKNWIGKIVGGFAGARPSGGNSAGKLENPVKSQDDPKAKQGGPDGGKGGGVGKSAGKGGMNNGVYIENLNNQGKPDDGQKVAQDINRNVTSHGAGMGW